MPTISGFTATAGQAQEIREALAYHQGVQVSEVTLSTVRTFMSEAVWRVVRNYRRYKRDQANPVDSTNPLE